MNPFLNLCLLIALKDSSFFFCVTLSFFLLCYFELALEVQREKSLDFSLHLLVQL